MNVKNSCLKTIAIILNQYLIKLYYKLFYFKHKRYLDWQQMGIYNCKLKIFKFLSILPILEFKI